MKFLAATILTMLLVFIAGLYFSWWSLAIASFLVALLVHQRAGKAFVAGFTAVFVLWIILMIWIDYKNEGNVSKKVATLLPLGGNSLVLMIVSALIGALVAGLGAMTASFLRYPSKPS